MNRKIWLYSLIVAGLLLLFGSASSPLFPYNVWDDANCFFTVGKSIFHGDVLYRDIFEQKGLYLYVIYGLGSLISRSSFFGPWLFEVAAFTVYLFFAGRILRFYARLRSVFLFLPILATMTITTFSFEKGGSAEEFCLPIFMILMCHALECFGKKGKGLTPLKMFIDGLLTAVVFFIKYNLVFPILGLYLIYLIYYMQKKEWGNLGKLAGLALAGFLTGVLPALLYFAINNAMGDLWFGYFYANLFLYQNDASWLDRAKGTVEFLARYMKQNPLILAFIVLGIAGFARRHRRVMGAGRFFILASLCMLCLGSVVIPVVVGVYYPLPLVVFSVFGMAELGTMLRGRTVFRVKPWKLGCLVAVCGIYTLLCSNTYFLLEIEKEELPQYEFAQIIAQETDPLVLNYGCLDTGIYTLAGVRPPSKFFCRLNLSEYPEMMEEQDRLVAEKKVDFIVTLTGTAAPDNFAGYRQIAYKEMYLTGATHYHLYQKVEG